MLCWFLLVVECLLKLCHLPNCTPSPSLIATFLRNMANLSYLLLSCLVRGPSSYTTFRCRNFLNNRSLQCLNQLLLSNLIGVDVLFH